jgi:hypothetical protein
MLLQKMLLEQMLSGQMLLQRMMLQQMLSGQMLLEQMLLEQMLSEYCEIKEQRRLFGVRRLLLSES